MTERKSYASDVKVGHQMVCPTFTGWADVQSVETQAGMTTIRLGVEDTPLSTMTLLGTQVVTVRA